MVRKKNTTEKKDKGNRIQISPNSRHTDWRWVWSCIAEVLGVTLLSVAVAVYVLWIFYSQGWVWRVSNALLSLSLLFFSFVPSFFYLYRRFTFKPRPRGENSPGNILRIIAGLFLLISLLNMGMYAQNHFAKRLDVQQITTQTPLDKLGRIGVQQLKVDTTRGIGWSFTTDKVHYRYSSETRFHCFVSVPIKGRKNDYWGFHISESHHSSTSDKRLDRYWKDFVERSQRIMTYMRPEDSKQLKRVTDDFTWGGYHMAIQQTFGKQAEKPFTVWETEDTTPTPLHTHLLWQVLFCGIMIVVMLIAWRINNVKRKDLLPPVPFHVWWREHYLSNRLLLLSPLIMMMVYIFVGELGGMRLAAEDMDRLISWGAPVRQLMEDGEWWRLLLAPFFPYSYFYFYIFAGMYGLYVWYCELRKHPYFIFAIYWITSVVATLCSMLQLNSDEITFSLLTGLFGVWGCHVGVFCIHFLRHPAKIKTQRKHPTALQRLNDLRYNLSNELPTTWYATIILICIFVLSLFTTSTVHIISNIIAAIVGLWLGVTYVILYPQKIDIQADRVDKFI